LVSSRRLAREWALKILYQADVGKMPVDEALTAALERLRREFVQRASQVANGSLIEEYFVDAITGYLAASVPHYTAPVEAALRGCFAQIFDASDFWAGLQVTFTFSRNSYEALWQTPNGSDALDLPSDRAALPPTARLSDGLTTADRTRLADFLAWAQQGLPDAGMRAFANEARRGRPQGAKMRETHEYVVQRWKGFTASMSERWPRAGAAVEKHACDWLRVAAFAHELVKGVEEHGAELDAMLRSVEIGWALDRQVSVDRNVLRMAAFELSHLPAIPASVTINEAVELAKKYSTAESGKFVNGILGAIAARMPERFAPVGPGGAELLPEAPIAGPDAELDEQTGDETPWVECSTLP